MCPRTDAQTAAKSAAFDLIDAVRGLARECQARRLLVCESLLPLRQLSKSGGLPFEDAELHVVIGATHCFDAALSERGAVRARLASRVTLSPSPFRAVDAVVQDNINPIEKAERSLLIMASTIQGAPAAALVQPEQVARLADLTPGLFPPSDSAGSLLLQE